MPDDSRELTKAQRRAAHMVAHGRSFSKITAKLDIDSKTLYRWRQLDDFRDLVDEEVSTSTAQLRRSYLREAQRSITSLSQIMRESESEIAKGKAAAKLAELGARFLLAKDEADSAASLARPESVQINFSLDPGPDNDGPDEDERASDHVGALPGDGPDGADCVDDPLDGGEADARSEA